jgi:alkylhydroperoxidase family enzyme
MMQAQPEGNVKPLLVPHPPFGEEDRVGAVFNAIQDRLGFIPDGLRLYSFSPPLLENFVANVSYFNGGTRLSPSLMAMIRYLVSWQSKCQFCIDMNEGFLTAMGLELADIRAARENPEIAPLPEKEKPLLRIALKAVNSQDGLGHGDLDAARAQGWTDRDIFDVVAQAASNRSFNMILRAFKVEHQGAFA